MYTLCGHIHLAETTHDHNNYDCVWLLVYIACALACPLPVDPLPVDPLPVDPLPVDPLPVDPLPVDPLPVDPLPVDPLPVDPLPVDPLPVDPLPVDPLPVDPLPVDPLPVDPLPVDPLPVDPLPVDPLPVDPLPEDPLPVDPLPVDPLPVDLYTTLCCLSSSSGVLPCDHNTICGDHFGKMRLFGVARYCIAQYKLIKIFFLPDHPLTTSLLRSPHTITISCAFSHLLSRAEEWVVT